MYALLWLIAVIAIVTGVVNLFNRKWALGAVLTIGGFLVGPGGYSIFHSGV